MKGQKNVATERHSPFAFILCYKIVLMFYNGSRLGEVGELYPQKPVRITNV